MKCNASSKAGRRAFLKSAGLAAIGTCLEPFAVRDSGAVSKPSPTHVLHIRTAQVELAPGRSTVTTTYDGQLPGPLLRATVGESVRVDVHNETDSAERIYWYGQSLAEEASLVPARGVRRLEFRPTRPGLHFYHSGLIAAARLDTGLYSGQAGALMVEARSHTGRYDREWVVVLKGCDPILRRSRRGCEVGYAAFTVNGRIPGHEAPLRAKTGERVLVHVLNASATEPHTLELPGHNFEVTALDGHEVPSPVTVPTLYLGPGERISAYVRVNQPDRWIVRAAGDATWDYSRFGRGSAPRPDETLPMALTRHDAARSGFNRWSINGATFSSAQTQPLYRIAAGKRCRLRIRNMSDEIVPVHLQRHQLEIVRVAATPTAGIRKDVVSIAPHLQVEVDFVADGRGPALFHCTRQLHKDFGLMARIDCT